MSPEQIYWDSVCFLGFLKKEQGKVAKCREVLDRAERGEVLIVTSVLTLTEVLWIRNKPRVPKADAEQVRDFFESSYIFAVDVSREIAEEAREIVWNFDIRPKDAIHVATAIHAGVGVLETFDRGLIGKSGDFNGYPLAIREPGVFEGKAVSGAGGESSG